MKDMLDRFIKQKAKLKPRYKTSVLDRTAEKKVFPKKATLYFGPITFTQVQGRSSMKYYLNVKLVYLKDIGKPC